ncbi:MAG TPA: XRE family transcriptional regulator [Streptosporangiaceae bacterium]|nr:XRE family transcriptional regulator [Streptosporangiaceae bacterium]
MVDGLGAGGVAAGDAAGAGGAVGAAGGAGAPASALVTQIAAALRRERSRAGISLTELARRAGIAKSTLSQLESGAGNPSVETLWALGNALGVPFSRLVDTPRAAVRVIRSGEGPATYSERSYYAATLLASCPPNARRDIYLIQAQPGEPRRSEPHLPGTSEHVVLGTGRALVGPADDPVELGQGDYIAYPGDELHIFKALDPGTTAIMIMEHV